VTTITENKKKTFGNDLSWAALWAASLGPITLPMAIVLFAYNVLLGGYSGLEGVVNPVWASSLASFILYLLIALIIRNANRAALLTIAANFIFFDVALVMFARKAWSQVNVYETGFYSVWAILFWALYAVFARAGLYGWRRAAGFVSAFCLVVQIQVIIYRKVNFTFVIWPRVHWNTITPEMAVASVPASEKPDMYYIILDTMPSQAVLEKIYDYHDHSFLDALKKRGFYVAEESHSNYPITMMSLSSSLNMIFLDKLALLMDDPDYAYDMTRFMIQNGRVPLFLKSYGYRFVNIGSGLGNTNWLGQADINLRSSFWDENFVPTFSGTLLGWPNQFEWMRAYIRRVRLDCFAKLAAARFEPSPKFVFCHILMPHVPCLFAADGSPVRGAITYNQPHFEKKLFLGQAIFARKKVLEAIDEILSKPGPKPVIVVQGDHGSAQLSDIQYPTKTWKNDFVRERFGILNAYYLPDRADIGLYQSITPVNSFRLIFNHYLHTKFPLEEDRNFATGMSNPFTFREVTDIIKNPNDDSNESTPPLEEKPVNAHAFDDGMD